MHDAVANHFLVACCPTQSTIGRIRGQRQVAFMSAEVKTEPPDTPQRSVGELSGGPVVSDNIVAFVLECFRGICTAGNTGDDDNIDPVKCPHIGEFLEKRRADNPLLLTWAVRVAKDGFRQDTLPQHQPLLCNVLARVRPSPQC
jgi:hypothetical protein